MPTEKRDYIFEVFLAGFGFAWAGVFYGWGHEIASSVIWWIWYFISLMTFRKGIERRN